MGRGLVYEMLFFEVFVEFDGGDDECGDWVHDCSFMWLVNYWLCFLLMMYRVIGVVMMAMFASRMQMSRSVVIGLCLC